MTRQTTQRSVSIVGLGNWGSSLAHALRAAGVPLLEVIVSGKRRRAARGVPCTTLTRATLQADIFWLCVPDAAIAAATRSLVARAAALGRNLNTCLVVHSSGALSASVLAPAADAGAAIASVHPVMTFPTRTPASLKDVAFGVEADAAGLRILKPIIRRIGGRPFPIGAGKKALYHAVGMLCSPLLVSHLAAALQTAELAGFSDREAQKWMQPIARATLDNFFRQGAGKSFSGPIARGDVETIRLHLQALDHHPMVAEVYRSLARYALDAIPMDKKASLRRKQLRPMLRGNQPRMLHEKLQTVVRDQG